MAFVINQLIRRWVGGGPHSDPLSCSIGLLEYFCANHQRLCSLLSECTRWLEQRRPQGWPESLSGTSGPRSVCPACFSSPRTVAFSSPPLSTATPRAVSAEPRIPGQQAVHGPETQPQLPDSLLRLSMPSGGCCGWEWGQLSGKGHAMSSPPAMQVLTPNPHTITLDQV